jgi:hypothetical protein
MRFEQIERARKVIKTLLGKGEEEPKTPKKLLTCLVSTLQPGPTPTPATSIPTPTDIFRTFLLVLTELLVTYSGKCKHNVRLKQQLISLHSWNQS